MRPPSRYRTAQAVLDELWEGWIDGPDTVTPKFVDYTHSRLRDIF